MQISGCTGPGPERGARRPPDGVREAAWRRTGGMGAAWRRGVRCLQAESAWAVRRPRGILRGGPRPVWPSWLIMHAVVSCIGRRQTCRDRQCPWSRAGGQGSAERARDSVSAHGPAACRQPRYRLSHDGRVVNADVIPASPRGTPGLGPASDRPGTDHMPQRVLLRERRRS